jgi:hypothetical protein
MRDSDSHIIRKTSVNFKFNGLTEGLSLQQDVSEWSRTVLASAIDSALSSYDNSEEIILIDKIQLDIDLGTTTDWKSGFGENIIRQLKEKLSDKIFMPQKDVTIKSASASFADILLYYLKFGILPWNAYFNNAAEFKSELGNWINNATSSEIKKVLLSLNDESSFSRLTGILNEEGFKLIVSVFSGDPGNKIALIINEIKSIIRDMTKEISLQKKLLQEYIEIHLKDSVAAYPESVLFFVVADWSNKIALKYDIDLSAFDARKLSNPEIVAILRKLQKDIFSGQEIKKDKLKLPPERPKNEAVKLKVSTKNALIGELREGVFIYNAGAVIIAPFLSALFSRTGLLKNDEIASESTALSTLNYCISGNATPVEFELLLLKILCGLPPEEAVEMASLEDENIIREADEMLKSVIEHWSVLKDTSINGLREAFLQRNGKLFFSEDQWWLFVEQKPYDMLLEQLPWNISMIKLPWMSHILRTQWV